MKAYGILYITILTVSLTRCLVLGEFLSNQIAQKNFRCAGQAANEPWCATGFCYDTLHIRKNAVEAGCASPKLCATTGCRLHTANESFVCCCAHSFCNGKSPSLVKARWRTFSRKDYDLQFRDTVAAHDDADNDKHVSDGLTRRRSANAGESPTPSSAQPSAQQTDGTTSTLDYATTLSAQQQAARDGKTTLIVTSATSGEKTLNTTQKASKFRPLAKTLRKFVAKVTKKPATNNTRLTTKRPTSQPPTTRKTTLTTKHPKTTLPTLLKNLTPTDGATAEPNLISSSWTKASDSPNVKKELSVKDELPEYKPKNPPVIKAKATEKTTIRTTTTTTTRETTQRNNNVEIVETTRQPPMKSLTILATTRNTNKNEDKRVSSSNLKFSSTAPTSASTLNTARFEPQETLKKAQQNYQTVPLHPEKQTTESVALAGMNSALNNAEATTKLTSEVNKPMEVSMSQTPQGRFSTNGNSGSSSSNLDARSTTITPIQTLSSSNSITASKRSAFPTTTALPAAAKRFNEYRNFPWYYVVVLGFLVSLVLFTIIYVLLRRFYPSIRNMAARNRSPRESLQHIKDANDSVSGGGGTGLVEEENANYAYRNGSFRGLTPMEQSSVMLLDSQKNKNETKNSILYPFKFGKKHSIINGKKNGRPKEQSKSMLIKPNVNGNTNDSLVSHCTAITTISANSSSMMNDTVAGKKDNKGNWKKEKVKEKAKEEEEDRELTVIDPLLNKQYTGTIHISTPQSNGNASTKN